MGSILLPGFGNASAVLYDGNTFQPYILSTKSDGSSGEIYSLFSQNQQTFSSVGHIALGWIIVIALAISLFLIILLVIGGLIAARIRRRREGYVKAPMSPPVGEANLRRAPPGQLFGDMEGNRRGYPML
jgi:Cortical protein marker for cell polarity